MKKLTKFLPLLLIGAYLLSGCAKERNNYDKWITAGTWTLVSDSAVNHIVFNQSSAIAQPSDGTSTSDSISVFGSGKTVTTEYQLTHPAAGAESSTTDITNTNNTMTVAFNTDGSFLISMSDQLVSTQHNTNTTTGSLISYNGQPYTSSFSGSWVWGNDVDTKQLITLDGMGTYDVKIEKGKLTLSRVSSSHQQQIFNTGGGTNTVTQTLDITRRATWSFTN